LIHGITLVCSPETGPDVFVCIHAEDVVVDSVGTGETIASLLCLHGYPSTAVLIWRRDYMVGFE